MVDVSSQNNSVSVNVSTGGTSASIKATPDMAQYYSEKSREWAISNRIVENIDYSSKYYAEKSKESATSALSSAEQAKSVKEQAIEEINSLKDAATNEIQDVAINATSDVTDVKIEALSNIQTSTYEAIEQIEQEGLEQFNKVKSTGFYMRDDKLYFINSKGEEEEFKSGAGMPIGTVYPLVCSPNYIPDGSFPTDGAEYTEAQFKGLWKNYLTSDEFVEVQGEWVITTPNTGQCICLYYSNNMFIMLQNQGNIFTSTDGINWVNSYSNTALLSQRRVAYGNGKFIVVGAGFLGFSEDGMNWSTVSHSLIGFTYTPQDLIFVNGKFFAVSKTTCYTFEDIAMTGAVNFTSAEIGTKDYYCITYGNNKFVAGGTGLSTSEDGVNWTEEVVLTLDGRTFLWQQIIFAKNKFVAVDDAGYVTSSEDGVNWTVPKKLSNVSSYRSTPLAYGNNKFAIMCKDGIYISTDGENWTKETIPTSFVGTPCLTYVQDKFMWFDSSKTGYRFDYTKPKSLLNTCSYDDYNDNLIIYGQCGKFAIDLENKTFKVPLIKDGAVIQQALTNDELGKAYNAGSPNITGVIFSSRLRSKTNEQKTGAFSNSGSITKANTANNDGADVNSYSIDFDASLSNPIYGNSETVQMNAVALRHFVVVANGQVNESMMDWSAWASSLQGKANVDFTNISNAAKVVINEYSSPDIANAIHVSSSPATNSTYTAPQDGWFYAFAVSASDSRSLLRLSVSENVFTTPIIDHNMIEDKGQLVAVNIPVCKGDTVLYVSINVTLTYGDYTNLGIWFVPKKGAQ